MNILVTGANGFIGSRLVSVLESNPKFNTSQVTRKLLDLSGNKHFVIETINASTDWSKALTKKSVVIHTAARAHVMKEKLSDPLSEYREINVKGTLNLARQSAAAGVKRFIFLSSIKVNGEKTTSGKPFTSEDLPDPEDAYGISKFEAEQGLQKLAPETEMEVVIIRPPLVYGPGVKGNFSSMLKLVERGLPLPFGAVHNKRSLIALDNLVALIVACIDHSAAANQVFLAGDGHDLSTTELLEEVAKAMNRSSRLIPVPAWLLMFTARLLGQKFVAQRLLGSLQVDISKAQMVLGWTPPISVQEGLRRCFV